MNNSKKESVKSSMLVTGISIKTPGKTRIKQKYPVKTITKSKPKE